MTEYVNYRSWLPAILRVSISRFFGIGFFKIRAIKK